MRKTRQTGISAIGLLLVLAIAGLLLLAATRIAPLYLDNYFVRGALNALANEPVAEMSNSEIRNKLQTHLDINNVRDIHAKSAKITRKKGKISINLDYERRVNFLGNLDVVVSFTNVHKVDL